MRSLTKRRRWLVAIFAALLLAGCRKTSFEPVAVSAGDMCDSCRMAITENRYAAEFIDNEGEAHKFDDIQCMLNFITEKGDRANIHAYYVAEFDTRGWVKAEEAHFVRSAQLKTPMGGGIVAFKEAERAREVAEKYQGVVIGFGDLPGLTQSSAAKVSQLRRRQRTEWT